MNLNDVVILDIECYSHFDIEHENAQYIEDAQIKYIGFYDYETGYHIGKFKGNEEKIKQYLSKFKVVITWNGDGFDIPILLNKHNNIESLKYKKSIDLWIFLFGNDNKIPKKKGKQELMELDFSGHSLKTVANELNFPVQKGDVDYMLFAKDEFTEEENNIIKEYLKADVEITKLIFDKVYNFWLPFASFLREKDVKNWCWLTSSIASIGYKYACNVMDWDEVYGKEGKRGSGGGKVIEPRVKEEKGIYYLDITSLYPHMYAMFNLFDEIENMTEEEYAQYSSAVDIWHGNNVFKVEGYYDITQPHRLSTDMMQKLRKRIELKKIDKKNPLVYAYKILLNSMYGANRNPMFASLYREHSGKDCCYLGRQINDIMENMMTKMGYSVISGDTDSIFVKPLNNQNQDQVLEDLKIIVDYINHNVPFPQSTFKINIEHFIDYIMFVPDESAKKVLKKNYIYVHDKKLEIMGLPIKKSNATKLGKIILTKYLESEIITNLQGKFDEKYIRGLIQKELQENINVIAQTYKVNRYEMYSSKTNCIQKQISEGYMNKKSGSITLIKNNKIGKIGSGEWKYCTLEEATKLTIENLDLTKVNHELSPFCKTSDIKTNEIDEPYHQRKKFKLRDRFRDVQIRKKLKCSIIRIAV